VLAGDRGKDDGAPKACDFVRIGVVSEVRHVSVLKFGRMETSQILELLVAQRDRLNNAIDALQAPAKRNGRPPKQAAPQEGSLGSESAAAPAPRKKHRKFSAAQRKAASERMRARWAAKRNTDAKAKKAASKPKTSKAA